MIEALYQLLTDRVINSFMLLNELKGVKKYYKLTWYEITQLLKRKGIKSVGSGRYGTVFTHPSWNYVVKVTTNDPSYLSFVDFVRKHPNKHYPLVLHKPLSLRAFHKRPASELKRHLEIVKIEKLQELSPNIANFVAENIERFVQINLDIKHKRDDALDYRVPNHQMLQDDGKWEKGMTNREAAARYPWMLELAAAWQAVFDSDTVEGSPDITTHNFMKRKDGTVVITDPVWEGSNPYKDYDAMIRRQSDYDYGDEGEVEGPAHLHKGVEQAIVVQFEDDIPF